MDSTQSLIASGTAASTSSLDVLEKLYDDVATEILNRQSVDWNLGAFFGKRQ
jgi:hypothetical protein